MIANRAIALSLAAVVSLAGPARAASQVTQVIDGLPQVIAPQQVIVSCNPAVLPGLCTQALNLVGAVITVTGLGRFSVAQLPAGASLQAVLDTLRASLAIGSADPNRIFIGSTLYPQTWEFPAAGAPGDATLLPGTARPLVAVLDSGVAYEDYRDALGSYRQAPVFSSTEFAAGWDFVNNDAHPNDDNGHGTAMAGIIVGRGGFSSAAIPFVGAGAGAMILPVKVLDSANQGTEFWLAEGIRYAVNAGADVINLSLDFARNYVPGAALLDAIAQARAAGVVVVAASGNTGDGRVLYPAAFPDVISVGAVRLDATTGYAVTSYSNHGEALDLVAPGGASGQDVNGDGLWDGDLAQSFPAGSPTQISWWLFAGTSPATAHVSSAAAALIGSGVAPRAVRPLLQATAADMGPGGWDAFTGSGRVQASAAVTTAASFVPPPQLYADAVVALRADGRASATVMIAGASGEGVANAHVTVRWRGAVSAAQTAATDASGVARFVSPAPVSSKKLFVVEVPRVIYGGATQRPRPFARSSGGFGALSLNVSLAGLFGSAISSTNGLTIWGYGGSGLASATTGSGLASATTGSGLASATTGSGLASATTGSGLGTSGPNSSPSYPLTLNVASCPIAFPLHSYGSLSLSVSQAYFSGAQLASGYSVRSVDSSWVMTPGAAAFDQNELGLMCGISVAQVKALSTSYFSSGTLYFGGVGSPPSGMGAGDNARFWSEVMNAEGSTAP